MTDFTPAFFPVFGTGAPGVNVARDTIYFDTSTTPFTGYVYFNGGWNAFGALGAVNATSIQGVAVDPTAPTGTQILTYNSGIGKWKPA